MAARTTSSRASASNGRSAAGPVEKAKATGNSVAKSARGRNGPALTAGAAVAGMAGGFALGSWRASRAPRGMGKVARAAGQLAQQLGALTNEVTSAGEDVRELQQLLRQANRRSPVEVLLDGLTHRRGGHKNES